MSRQIIDYGDGNYHGLLVNTFWGGKDRGECVQFTEGTGQKGYVQMTRDEALHFLSAALALLTKQVHDDETNPPWWQELAEPVKGRQPPQP